MPLSQAPIPPSQSPSPAPSAPPPQWGMLAIGLLAGVLLSGGALLLWERPTPPPIAIQLPPTTIPASEALPSPTPTPAPITVHVAGAVQQPGVYTLPAGARVVHALDAAGGLLPDADGIAVNQAELLYDGAQVYVPVAGDGTEPPAGVSGGTRSGALVIPDVGVPEVGRGLVNVNTAGAAELESLPGIGPAKAKDIIANRPYTSIDDLDRVPGIGPATLDGLRDFVTVQ